MTLPAYDPRYDTINEPVTIVQAYIPELRDWRPVRCRRVLFGRHMSPADADAVMAAERLPEESWRNAAARKGADTLMGKTDRIIFNCLRQYGPQTRDEIAARTGKDLNTISKSFKRRPDLFGHDGKRRNRLWHALQKGTL